jgi:hypothetical protein
MDTQSGLIDNLTTAEIQLVVPILPILEAETSQDRVFILLEHENESLSPYQYQSDISREWVASETGTASRLRECPMYYV